MAWHSTGWPKKKTPRGTDPAKVHPRAPPGGAAGASERSERVRTRVSKKRKKPRELKDYFVKLKARLDKEKLDREL